MILFLASAALSLLANASCSMFGLHHTNAAVPRQLISDSSQVTSPPMLLTEVNPRYPRKAQRDGVEAVVSLKLVVDEKGNVASAIVVDTKAPRFKREFERAAIKAVKQWKFAPAVLNDKPVACYAKVVVRFRIK